MSTASAPLGSREPMCRRVLSRPSTLTGRRAAWLAAAVMGLFVLDGALAAAGASDWGDAARLALGLSGALALLAAIVSFVLSMRALRMGDRSIVLLWPLLVGAAALLFVVGEFAFPH